MRGFTILLATGCVVGFPVLQAADNRGAGPRYRLTDLGPLGPAGQVIYIAGNGLAAGATEQPDHTDHATLFFGRRRLDISQPGIGGKNSLAYAVNISGQAVGGAETGEADPGGTDFCGFQTLGLAGSGGICAPFVWQNGLMKELPNPLGGKNGSSTQINRFGAISGEVENAIPDPGCPQRFEFRPVKWQGSQLTQLPTFPGDPDGVAYAINDAGQVAGSTGACAPYNPNFQLAMLPQHIMLWEADGTPRYLGTLGGTGTNPNAANLAININSNGHVVGTSALAGDETGHAFLWTEEKGMQDLGTLPGDFVSGAAGINDSEQMTGISIGADGPRAVVWLSGSVRDLNDLVRPTTLHLILGASINADGQVAGFAVDTKSGEIHGYIATPQGDDGPGEQAAARLFRVEDAGRLLKRLGPLSRYGIRFVPEW